MPAKNQKLFGFKNVQATPINQLPGRGPFGYPKKYSTVGGIPPLNPIATLNKSTGAVSGVGYARIQQLP